MSHKTFALARLIYSGGRCGKYASRLPSSYARLTTNFDPFGPFGRGFGSGPSDPKDSFKDPKKEDSGGGPKKEDSTGGPKKEDSTGGGPKKEDSTGGGPKKEDSTGGGPKKEDFTGGGPKKEDTSGGGPRKEDTSGGGGPRKEDTSGGGPRKEDTSGGGPRKEDSSGGGPNNSGSQPNPPCPLIKPNWRMQCRNAANDISSAIAIFGTLFYLACLVVFGGFSLSIKKFKEIDFSPISSWEEVHELLDLIKKWAEENKERKMASIQSNKAPVESE